MSKQHPDVPHGTTGHPQLGNRVRLGSYVWDPTSGMWYDESSQFYFEEKSKLYTKRNNPHWYVFDTKQKKLVKTDRRPRRRKSEVREDVTQSLTVSPKIRARSSGSLPDARPNSFKSHTSTGQTVKPSCDSNTAVDELRADKVLLDTDDNVESTVKASTKDSPPHPPTASGTASAASTTNPLATLAAATVASPTSTVTPAATAVTTSTFTDTTVETAGCPVAVESSATECASTAATVDTHASPPIGVGTAATAESEELSSGEEVWCSPTPSLQLDLVDNNSDPASATESLSELVDADDKHSLSLGDTTALTKGILCHAAPLVRNKSNTNPARRPVSPRKPANWKPSRRSSFKVLELMSNQANDILDASACAAECFLVCGVDRLRHPAGLQPQLLHCYPKRSEPVTDFTGVSNFVFPFGMTVDTQPWAESFYFLVLTSGTGEFSYLSTLCFPERCPPSVTAIICCEELKIQFLQFIQQQVKTTAEAGDKPAATTDAAADPGAVHSTNVGSALTELAFNLTMAIHRTVGNLNMPTLRQLVAQMRPEDLTQSHLQLRALGSELEALLDALDTAAETNNDKEVARQRKALERKLVEIHGWLSKHLRPVLDSFCEVKQLSHLFVSKALVICSEYPFYRFFQAFLEEIIAMLKQERGHRQGWLESWISYLTRDVPVPPLGRVALGTRLRPHGRLITLSLPPPGALPLADFDMQLFFRRLPMNHVVVLFLCALCEVKIIFFSEDPHLLGLAGQTLLSLLHPIKWVCTYIPLLPLKMRGCLGSPAPGIFGTHPRARNGELQDMTIMDLDCEELSLPAFIPLKSLVTVPELQALYDKLSKWAYGDTFSQRHVRFAFADFVTSLLQNYRRYISPLTDHDRANRMAFDSDLFCKQKKNFAENPFFYESFSQSQMLEAFAQECQAHMSGDEISTDVMFLQSRIDLMTKAHGRNLASFAADTSSDISELQLLMPPNAPALSAPIQDLATPSDPNDNTAAASSSSASAMSADNAGVVFPALRSDRFGRRNITVRDDLQRRLQADSIQFRSNIRIVDKVELAVGEVARAGFFSGEFCNQRIEYCKKHHAAHTENCRQFLSTVEMLYNHTTLFFNSLKKQPSANNTLKVSEFFLVDPCTSFSKPGGMWTNFVDAINNLRDRAEFLLKVLQDTIVNLKNIIRDRNNVANALQQYAEMHLRFFEQTKTMYERSREQRNKQLALLKAKAGMFSPLLHKDGLTKGLLEKMFDIMSHYQNICEKQLRVGADAAAFASYLPVHLQSFDIALKHYRHLERDCLDRLKVYVRNCMMVGVVKYANALLNFKKHRVLPGLVPLPDLSKHHVLVGRPDDEERLSAVQQLEGVFNRWLNGMRATKRACREGYNLALYTKQAYQNFLGDKTGSVHKVFASIPKTITTPKPITSPIPITSPEPLTTPKPITNSKSKTKPRPEPAPQSTNTPVLPDTASETPQTTSAVSSTDKCLNCSHSDADSDDGSEKFPELPASTTTVEPVVAPEKPVVVPVTPRPVPPLPPPLPQRQFSRDLPVPRLDWVLDNVDRYLVGDVHALFSTLMKAISTHQEQMLRQSRINMKTERLRLVHEREKKKLVVDKCQQNFDAARTEAEAQTKVTNQLLERVRAQEKKAGEGPGLLECRISGPEAINLHTRRRFNIVKRGVRVSVNKSAAFLQGVKQVRSGHLLLKIEDTVVASMKKQEIKTRLASATFPLIIVLGNPQHTTLWKLQSDVQVNRQREEQLMVKLGDAQETLLQQEQSYLTFKREAIALFERLERQRVDLILSKMNASARMDIENLSSFKGNSLAYCKAIKSIDLESEHQPWIDFNRKLKKQQRLILQTAAPFSDRYARVHVGSNYLRPRRFSTERLSQEQPRRLSRARAAQQECGNRSTWEISSLWTPHFEASAESPLPCSSIGSAVESDYIDIGDVKPSAYDKFVALLDDAGETSRRTQHFLDTNTKIQQSLLKNLRNLCASWEGDGVAGQNNIQTAPTDAEGGENQAPTDSPWRLGRVTSTSISGGTNATEGVAEAILTPCAEGVRKFVRVHMQTVREWCAGIRHAADGLRIFKHAAAKLQAAVKAHKDVINSLLAAARNQYEMSEKRQNVLEFRNQTQSEKVLEFRTRAAKEFLGAAQQSHQTQMAQLLSFGMQRFKRWLHGMHQHVLVPFRLAFEIYCKSCKHNTDAVLQCMRDALLDPTSLQRIKATVCTTIDQTATMAPDYYSTAEWKTNGFNAARSCVVAHQALIKQMHDSLHKFLQQLWDHAKKVVNEKKPKVDNGSMSGLSISTALEAVIAGVYGVAYTTLLRCCNSNDRAQFELRCAAVKGDIHEWRLLPSLSTTRGLEWFTSVLTQPAQKAGLDFLIHTKQHKALLQLWTATDNIQDRSNRGLTDELKPSQKHCLLNIQQHAAKMEDTFVFADQTSTSRPQLSAATANALSAKIKAVLAVDVSKLEKVAEEGVGVCVQRLFDEAELEVCEGLQPAFAQFKKSRRAMKFLLDLHKTDVNFLPSFSELRDVTQKCCKFARNLWTEWGRDVECLNKLMEVTSSDLSAQDGKATRMQRLHRKYKKKGNAEVTQDPDYKATKAGAIDAFKSICVRSVDGGISCLDQLTTAEHWFAVSVHAITQDVSNACEQINVEADVSRVLAQFAITFITNKANFDSNFSDDWDEDSDS